MPHALVTRSQWAEEGCVEPHEPWHKCAHMFAHWCRMASVVLVVAVGRVHAMGTPFTHESHACDTHWA